MLNHSLFVDAIGIDGIMKAILKATHLLRRTSGMSLEINTQMLKRVMLVEADGRVDSTTADQLGEVLNTAIDDGTNQLVLDLSKVEYMSSAGLREMVSALKRVQRGRGDLRLAALSDRVKEVLELAGLDEIFNIYDTQVEAVGSFT